MVRMSLHSLLDLVLPVECAGCHRVGSTWCRRCARSLGQLAFAEGPRSVSPDPPPPGMPPVWSWGHYADPLRAAITAWKDEGRRDLAVVLAPLLSGAVATAVAEEGDASTRPLIVPAPSSRRSRRTRGDVPIRQLAGLALDRGHPPLGDLAAVLDQRRAVRDQAGLTTAARRDNVTGAFLVPGRWRPVVGGRVCVVVDDVMTTGATLVECARALGEAGAARVVGATIAVPRRRRGALRAGPDGLHTGARDTTGLLPEISLPRGLS